MKMLGKRLVLTLSGTCKQFVRQCGAQEQSVLLYEEKFVTMLEKDSSVALSQL